VFEYLRQAHPQLRLAIIGAVRPVPRWLRRCAGVEMTGDLDRQAVIERLRCSRFYISTTRIENSYNAAAEGAFLAEEALVSDIGPHRELFQGERHSRLSVPQLGGELLHVRREQLTGLNLKTWDAVIGESLEHYAAVCSRVPSAPVLDRLTDARTWPERAAAEFPPPPAAHPRPHASDL
jgi:hypothetical protein